MVSSITFRGGETTGGVSDRKIETAKQETTGGVGVRQKTDSIFIDNELQQDTVSFRANHNGNEKKTSGAGAVFGTIAGLTVLVGLLGLSHKYDLVGKIKHKDTQYFLRHTDVVTEKCHKACKWVKNNSYDKVVAFFSKKK